MNKDRTWYTQANRVAWDEAAPRHAEANQAKLLKRFAKPGHVQIDKHLLRALANVPVPGARVAQLCCNNGVDLLSIKNLGAGHCVGFDQSEAFLEQARSLAAAADLDDVEFHAADLYALSASQHGVFDIVLTTIGVVGWMPDLYGFFDVAADLTATGGHLVMEEMHPVLLMYEPGQEGAPTYLAYSYFGGEEFVETEGLDYFTGTAYNAKPAYSFQYTLAEIMTAAMRAGFVLRHFEELAQDISLFCSDLEQSKTNPPLGMTLVWKKCRID